MTLVYLVAAWVAGLFLVPDEPAILPWLVIVGGAAGLAIWQRRVRSRRLILLCVMLFALGAARYAQAARPLNDRQIGSYAGGGYATLTGIIARDPDIRDQHVNLHINAQTIEVNRTQHSVTGLVLVQAPRYGEYTYGDRVRVRGPLLVPYEFDDFSYRDYLARRGIHALVPNAQLDILEHDQGQSWQATLFNLKIRALHTIDRLLPSPEAPLLSGILLGVESGIPASVRDNFNATGTAHVIAISGSNIIIVIQVLLSLLTPAAGVRRARLLTVIGVGGYTALVGADPAVVRAALMGSLSLMALQSGRRAHGLTSLALAIWIMTLWNPFTLWDIGFQLSVAATLGLIIFSRDFSQQLERLLQRGFAQPTARSITRWLSEPVVVSIAAQITTTPLIMLYFGRLSLISLFANLLIVPVQAFIMTLGWLAVVAGLVWAPLGEPIAWIAWLPLTYTLRIVEALADFRWATISYRLPESYAWVIYALLVGWAMLLIQHPEDRAALLRRISQRMTALSVLVTGGILVTLVWLFALTQPDGKLHVWYLDVGHGHAVLIQTPKGAQILVDGGPNPTRLRQAVGATLPFWDRDLDMVIVTQPKSDAINALPALLERYDTHLILTNGQTSDTAEYTALAQLWQDRRANVHAVTAGYQVKTGDGVVIDIVHPQTPPDSTTKPEDAALVIRVRYGESTFLLASDLTAEAGTAITTAGWFIGSTVLELPAHGSEKVNTPEFIAGVNPQIAVTGVGAGNRSNLPAPVVQEQIRTLTGYPLYRTDQHGTIEMITDGTTLWVYTSD